jgi:hypothetical protein
VQGDQALDHGQPQPQATARRDSEVSACTNGSKMLSSSAGSIPTP